MRIDETLINYSVFRGAKEFLGTADVTPPDISWMTGELSGAGVAGKINYPIIGHLEAMTVKFTFRTMTRDALEMIAPDRQQFEVRGARQDEDTETGRLIVVPIKHVYVLAGQSYSPGVFAPQTTANGTGEYAVRYWAIYENGAKLAEFDPLNYICTINGVDYLASVRSALGK